MAQEGRTVRLRIESSRCRAGLHTAGEEYLVTDRCPPLCHELWQVIYPSVYVLQNGGDLDYGETRAKRFAIRCPDQQRVLVVGEVVEDLDRT